MPWLTQIKPGRFEGDSPALSAMRDVDEFVPWD